jgi:hypothetical protein
MRVLVGAWLESIGAGLLTLFSIGLAARIRERDGGRTPLGPIAVAGGVGTGTLLLVRAAAVAAAAERGPAEGDTAQTATLAIDIGNLLVGKMAPVSLALVTGAATIAGRKYALMPPWLARVTVALTAGLLSPINFVFIAPGLVWVATIGWLITSNEIRRCQTGEHAALDDRDVGSAPCSWALARSVDVPLGCRLRPRLVEEQRDSPDRHIALATGARRRGGTSCTPSARPSVTPGTWSRRHAGKRRCA